MTEVPGLPPELAEAFLRLCSGDFSHRLPRTMLRDQRDTAAFFFNTIAEELERILRTTQENEQRLSQTVERLTQVLTRVAAGDFTAEVERDFRGDPLDVLAFLVNQTVSEISALVEAEARRAADEKQRLETLVAERTQQLRASEEDLRHLLEAAPAPMMLISEEDATVSFVNERAAALLGAPREAIVGRPAPEIFERREDRKTFLSRLRHEGQVDAFVASVRTLAGQSMWSLINARRLSGREGRSLMVSFADLTEQKQIEGQLRTLATTDALTSTMNRRRFFEVADDEVGRASRYSRPLCLAMIDIDHFKKINDRFGHGVGDEALRLVAQTIRSQLRKQDQLGRYGGEEFAVLLPETLLDSAVEVMERSRSAVAALTLEHEGVRVPLSVSAGVVAWLPDESLEATLSRADAALYEAKGAGRNRVVARQAPVPRPVTPTTAAPH